jgi:primosomal protein N'
MVPEKLWSGSFDPGKQRSQAVFLGDALPRGKRQTEAWKAVKDAGESLSFETLKESVPWMGKAFLKRMVEAGALRTVPGNLPAPYFRAAQGEPSSGSSHPEPALRLTASQKQALETIGRNGHRKPYLLFGPPASGKTEVYLELAKRAVSNGKQALILVPEIALTTQLIAYFIAAFGTRIAVLHSQLNDTERCIEWERLRTGEATVAIGSRIALFAPFRTLGCICVDEEHEWTYKSEQTPRYHARDVAIKLGELVNSLVILGSATPSIESFTYAKLGKYELLKLERI